MEGHHIIYLNIYVRDNVCIYISIMYLLVSTVARQNKGPCCILGKLLLRLLHATAVDVPLDKLHTHTHTLL